MPHSSDTYFIELYNFKAEILKITTPTLLKLKQTLKKIFVVVLKLESRSPGNRSRMFPHNYKLCVAIYFFSLLIHFIMTVYY